MDKQTARAVRYYGCVVRTNKVFGTANQNSKVLGKPQIKKCRVYLGIAQMGGGSKRLPGWFGALI